MERRTEDRERERAAPGRREGTMRHDGHASPRRSDDQDAPEPERTITPEELAGQAIQDLEEPPQAEGPREPDQ